MTFPVWNGNRMFMREGEKNQNKTPKSCCHGLAFLIGCGL